MSGHVLNLLSAYLDGELSPPERGVVEAHLAACEECAARLEDFAAVDLAARGLPAEAPAGYFDTFAQRLRPRLRSAHAPRRIPVWTWAAAAALLLAVLTPLTLQRAPELAPQAPPAARAMPSVVDQQKSLPSDELELQDRAAEASAPRPRRVPAPIQAPVKTREQADSPGKLAARAPSAEPPPPPQPAPAVRSAAVPTPAATEAAADDGFQPETSAAPKLGRAEERLERLRERDAASPRDAESGRTAGEAAPAGAGAAGLRGGVSGGTLGRQEIEAGDEFALLRARSQPGAGEQVEALRDLRDAWRSFAARNPSGARGDEARWQVIEIGLRAWRAGGDAQDRAVLLRDGRTYLERGDGAHEGRVRAVLAEVSGPT